MNNGYLCIDTHTDHPGLLRLLTSLHTPQLPHAQDTGSEHISYVARFNDIEAAMMHTHTLLRRCLLDPDAHLYRVSLAQAIAAIESLDLKHSRVYLDPDLDENQLAQISHATDTLTIRRKRRSRLIDAIGYLALGIILLQALMTLFG